MKVASPESVCILLKCSLLFQAILVETIHSVGLNIFIFALLPTVDPFTGVFLCMNVALVPSFLGLFYSGKFPSLKKQIEEAVVLFYYLL